MAVVGVLISALVGILFAAAGLIRVYIWLSEAYGDAAFFMMLFVAGIVLTVSGMAIEKRYE